MCILSGLTQGMIFEFILRVLILFGIRLIITLGQLGSNSQFLEFFLRCFQSNGNFFAKIRLYLALYYIFFAYAFFTK
jgi:hypothetical protein